MRGKIILIILMIILLVILLFNKKNEVNSNFNIHFFNAGKADSCVIKIDDKVILIDTGEYTLRNTILRYLSDNNISVIDYLTISHFDKDHVGSASYIIDNVSVLNVLQSNVPKDSEYYDLYIKSLSDKGINPITVSDDYYFEIGDSKFVVNGPNVVYDKNSSNNSSLIVSLEYGSNSFLFMGDAQNDRINDFIGKNNKKYDFMKIPYHGNYQKSLSDLISNTGVKFAVISTSSSVYDDKMIDLLDSLDVKYYATFNGDIDVFFDDGVISIKQ